VVGHGADDGQVLASVHEFDQPCLAGPVHDGTRCDLPEPTCRIAWVAPAADGVGVRVPVQPQDDVAEPVQEGKQIVLPEKGLPARAGVPGIGQRVDPVVGKDDDQTIVMAGPDLMPGRIPVAGVHLGEPCLQPPGLLVVQAARGTSRQAVGVQRDQPDGRGVMNVVRGAVQPVLLGEPVPCRAGSRPEMGRHEIPPGDRPPPGVGRDGADRASQEGFGALGEQFQRPVMVEHIRQRPWLPAADPGVGQAWRCRTDTLVERLVIAETGEPGDGEPAGVELPQGTFQQARVVREAEFAPEEIGAAGPVAVRLPEEVVRPVERLDAVVTGTPGIGHDKPPVEQGQERLQFVPLGVVDGVPRRHRERQRRAGDRPVQGVDRAQRGVDRVHGERLLRALHRDDVGIPGVGEMAVEELEPGG
jgi:hypothetical protein